MIDVSELEEADYDDVTTNYGETFVRRSFHAVAHDVVVSYITADPTMRLWVSPILTMREKGVALVDESGQMIVHRRVDR